MKIIEITASLGRTVQLEPYSPLNFHASIKAEVSENENLEKAFSELKKIVKDQVDQEIKKATDVLAGEVDITRDNSVPF